MSKIKTAIEFEFMMEALREKFSAMLENLGEYEEEDDFPENFVLNESQVKAMKAAGVWDDPLKRYEVIKRYAEFQKASDLFDEEYKKRNDKFAVKKVPARRGRPPAKKTARRTRK